MDIDLVPSACNLGDSQQTCSQVAKGWPRGWEWALHRVGGPRIGVACSEPFNMSELYILLLARISQVLLYHVNIRNTSSEWTFGVKIDSDEESELVRLRHDAGRGKVESTARCGVMVNVQLGCERGVILRWRFAPDTGACAALMAQLDCSVWH